MQLGSLNCTAIAVGPLILGTYHINGGRAIYTTCAFAYIVAALARLFVEGVTGFVTAGAITTVIEPVLLVMLLSRYRQASLLQIALGWAMGHFILFQFSSIIWLPPVTTFETYASALSVGAVLAEAIITLSLLKRRKIPNIDCQEVRIVSGMTLAVSLIASLAGFSIEGLVSHSLRCLGLWVIHTFLVNRLV